MVQPQLQPPAGPHRAAIEIKGGEFGWSDEGATLHDVNLEILEGQLLMVVGEVGCGKSSLLSAILSEMDVRGGRCRVAGNASHSPLPPLLGYIHDQIPLMFV